MTLTLAISDNADGTGGVATIGGSSVASVGVYRAAYSSGMGSAAWTLTASRTGDGTVAVAPGTGYWFWYALSATPAVSNLVNQNLTSGLQAVHYRCLTAVQAQMQALALPKILQNVLVLWQPLEDKPLIATVPAAYVCPIGREGQPGILNGKDDIEYPVLVGVNDQGYNDYLLGLAQRLLWRQSTFRTFRHQRLPGVPEIITTDVEPNAVIDEKWFKEMKFVSSLLFKFRSREVRGFGM